MLTIQDILRDKGAEVFRVAAGASLNDAIQLLVQHNVGSLLVCSGEDCQELARIEGILTERDVLRACARNPHGLQLLTVGEVMSSPVRTIAPGECVERAMGMLTEYRIRHLPVVEGDQLRGMISIGDVVKAQHNALSLENHYLKSYLSS